MTNLRSQDVKKKIHRTVHTGRHLVVIEPILECSVTGYYLISHRFLTEVKFLMKEYSVRFLVNNYSIFFNEFEFYLLF